MKATKAAAIEMSAEVLAGQQDINAILASNPEAPVWAEGHYANQAAKLYGAEQLIADILRNNGAVFPASVGESEYRSAAIGAAMFASEIQAAIQERFTAGTKRHPYFSVHTFLCQHLANKKDGDPLKVGRIRLTYAEDKGRKPRIKWFLIQ